MDIPASNLKAGENYEIFQHGMTQGIGTFTGKREGILGNPIMKLGDAGEKGFSAARYSFTPAKKGGRRHTRRRSTRRHGRKHTRVARRR